jgi:nucleoid DNA-binding protein
MIDSPFGSRLSKKEIADYLKKTFGIRSSEWRAYEKWFRWQFDFAWSNDPDEWPWDEVGLTIGIRADRVPDTDNDKAMIVAMSYAVDRDESVAKQALQVINAFIASTVKRGQYVQFKGFGRFYLQRRQPWTFVNPKNGAAYQIPGKRVVKFRAYRDLMGVV